MKNIKSPVEPYNFSFIQYLVQLYMVVLAPNRFYRNLL